MSWCLLDISSYAIAMLAIPTFSNFVLQQFEPVTLPPNYYQRESLVRFRGSGRRFCFGRGSDISSMFWTCVDQVKQMNKKSGPYAH